MLMAYVWDYYFKNKRGQVSAPNQEQARTAAQQKLKLKDKERGKITIILAAQQPG